MAEIDLETVEVHIAAWVKLTGEERGFAANNYNRYGYKQARGLERWLDRNRIKKQRTDGKSKTISGNFNSSNKSNRHGNRTTARRTDSDLLEYRLEEIRDIPYGQISPTMNISKLSHLDWLREMIGFHRYRFDLKPLNELQDLLWTGHKELGLLPRHGGKTVTYLGMTAKEIAERREPHLTICSPKRPKVLFKAVTDVLLKSSRFRQFYGDIVQVKEGRVQANFTDLTVTLHDDFDYDHTDYVYRAASRETDIIGSHPVHIHFEDPTQQETIAGTQKLIEWYSDVVEPMLSLEDGTNTRLTATTTRKGRRDFANFLFEDGWDEFRYAAVEVLEGRLPNRSDIVWKTHKTRSGQITRKIDYIEKTGKFKLFNPDWNLQSLLEKAIKKYSSFMSQYQNTPISVQADFLEPFDIIDPIYREHYEGQEVMIVDPAFGKSAGSSETAILIGFAPSNMDDIYITECVIKRLYGTKLVKEIYRLWDLHKLKWGKIEDDYSQISTRQGINKELKKLSNFATFTNRQFGDKHARIQMLEEPLMMKQIHVFNTCEDLHKLEDQVNGYSEEVDIKHGWDGVDGLSSFHRIVSRPGKLYARSWTSRR